MTARVISALRVVQFLADLGLLAASFYVAYQLRFDFDVPALQNHVMWKQMPLFVGGAWLALFFSGAYQRAWRYVSLVDVHYFLYPLLAVAAVLVALRIGLPDAAGVFRVPLSISMVSSVLSFLLLMALRISWRLNHERVVAVLWPERARLRAAQRESATLQVRQALIGAGDAGVMAVREFRQRGQAHMLVGFFDDDVTKHRQVIAGLRVLGGSEAVPDYFRRGLFEEAIITIGNRSGQDLARLARICEEAGIPTRVIPPLGDILSGAVSITNIRPVSIEDLLGREEAQLDRDAISAYLRGKRVLVTGAGGSIGSELVRQIARFAPEQIVMLDQGEYALFEINREVQEELAGTTRFEPVLADICDVERLRRVFTDLAPQVIFHAAAYKHVPLTEVNEAEALENNVLGTRQVARLAGEAGSEVFVLVSSDKAVNPTSVMGATKRLAEIVTQDLNAAFPQTRYLAVRFGNVLGSTGSVVPLFREQISRGGPVQVTHPDMQRYFMTIPEAAQLVMQSAAMGEGGEVFILDMGDPVKIVDLARDLIRLSGFVPDRDIQITFSGVRPGEKLYEELSTAAESVSTTRHPKIMIGRNHAYPADRVADILAETAELVMAGDGRVIRERLARWLPEFLGRGTG